MQLFKNLKSKLTKAFLFGVAAVTVLGAAIPAQAAAINDTYKVALYARNAVTELTDKGILIGDQAGNFNPTDTVTRGEMVTVIIKTLGLDTAELPAKPTFTDVPADHWAYKYVEAAYKKGIVKGKTDGTFGVNEKCTREQMATMFVQALGLSGTDIRGLQQMTKVNALTDKAYVSDWAKDCVEFALVNSLMKGSGTEATFAPKASAERQQAAVVAYKLMTDKDTLTQAAQALYAKIQYPELLQAMKAESSDFKGEINSSIKAALTDKIKVTDTNGNEQSIDNGINFDINVNGVVNGQNSHLNLAIKGTGTDISPTDMNLEVISLDGKYYVNQDSTGWVLQTLSDITGGGMPEVNPSEIKELNSKILSYYNSFDIQKQENADVNGTMASKYTITLNRDMIKSLILDIVPGMTPEDLAGIDEVFKDGFICTAEIYLDQSNHIVKDTYTLTAHASNAELQEEININLSVDSQYSKIGEDLPITAPETYTTLDAQ